MNLGFIITDDFEMVNSLILLKQGRKELLTSSSLMLVKGEVGSGKSRLAMNLMVGFLGGNDQLGLEYIQCPEGKHIIYVSTEMSRYHLAKRRNKILELIPQDQKSKLVVSDIMNCPNKVEVFNNLITAYPPHVIIIDQLADFVASINDLEMVNKMITSLSNGVETSDCGVIAIVHQNEDSGISTKARGHLGSTLEQKVVSSLAIADSRRGFRIKSTKVREGGVLDEIYAVFDEETEMLKSITPQEEYGSELTKIFNTLILPDTKTNVCEQIGKYLKSDNYDTQKSRLTKLLECNFVTEVKEGNKRMIHKQEEFTGLGLKIIE